MFALNVIIIIIIIIIFIFWNSFSQNENLIVTQQFPKYCNTCSEFDFFKCNLCANCGYCVTERGVGSCVEGDGRGPYFREDCVEWYPHRSIIYDFPIYVYGYGYNPTYTRELWKFRKYRSNKQHILKRRK